MEVLSAVSTILLVFITGYYAITTHKMLNNQKELTLFEMRPFLALEGIESLICKQNESDTYAGIQIGLNLKNVSRVLLKYEMVSMSVLIDGLTVEKPKFLNNGGYVYPSQYTTFSFDTILGLDICKDVFVGVLEYTIEYFSTENKKYQSIRKYRITIDNKYRRTSWVSLVQEEIEL